MRIACVAGFFNPVKTSLDKKFPKEIVDGCVIWIPQISNGQLNVNLLKQALFDGVARGATEILILIFLFRGTEYLLEILNSLIAEALARSPELQVRVNSSLKNARDADAVVKAITAFAPQPKAKTYPATLDGVAEWVGTNHPKTIFFHPRAKGGAAKSRYTNVSLIYQAIEALTVEYHAMRTSTPDDSAEKKMVCDRRFQELELELSPSISPSRAGEEGDDYLVSYPPGQLIAKRTLDLHLKKGSDREERNCLRIYFFWDDDAQKVVIGWLPNHLDTRAT